MTCITSSALGQPPPWGFALDDLPELWGPSATSKAGFSGLSGALAAAKWPTAALLSVSCRCLRVETDLESVCPSRFTPAHDFHGVPAFREARRLSPL